MSDTTLPPLPEPTFRPLLTSGARYSADETQAYARKCVDDALDTNLKDRAALAMRVEELKKQRDVLQEASDMYYLSANASLDAFVAECKRLRAECKRLRAERAALEADRNSWYQQHSDRVDDAVRFGKEADELRAECALLRDHAAGKITDATLMTSMSTANGCVEFGLQGGAAQLLAEGFAQQFKDDSAVNYIEYRFVSQESMPGAGFVVTMQRIDGLTPAQKLAAAEAECADIKAQLATRWTAYDLEKAERKEWMDRAQDAEAECAALMALRDGVVIDSYAIPGEQLESEIKIQRARQIEGPALWKVSFNGACLNKAGKWEWEPLPSSRDDEFLARCRFATAEEAIDAAMKAVPREGQA